MKTPDEIKKGLETCIGECTGNKPHCPYHECGNGCMDTMNRNSLAYITHLESRLAQVERERDAMAKIIEDATTYLEDFGSVKFALMQLKKWRGVCAENSKEE